MAIAIHQSGHRRGVGRATSSASSRGLVSHSQAKECITVWQARRRTSTPRTSLGVLAASVSQRSGGYTYPRPWGPCRRRFPCDDLPSLLSRWLLAHLRATTTARPARPFGSDRIHRRTAGLERGAGDQQCRVERSGTVDHHVQRPARRVTATVTGDGTWTVQAVVSGLTTRAAIRAAHIHNGAAGVNAGVFVDTLLTPANAIPTAGRRRRTINFEQVLHHAAAGPGRAGQPGRQLLQHALAPQSRAASSAASWLGCR